jgi:drug/metabolite transporter (DMT)-like permease
VSRRASLLGLALATVLLAVGYAGAFVAEPSPGWAIWSTAMGTGLAFLALVGLGSARHGRPSRTPWVLGLLAVVLLGGFGAMILLPPPDPENPVLWLGLPPGAAVLIYGVGLLPFFLAPISYALTFEEWTLREEDLERVREMVRERREREAREPGISPDGSSDSDLPGLSSPGGAR